MDKKKFLKAKELYDKIHEFEDFKFMLETYMGRIDKGGSSICIEDCLKYMGNYFSDWIRKGIINVQSNIDEIQKTIQETAKR